MFEAPDWGSALLIHNVGAMDCRWKCLKTGEYTLGVTNVNAPNCLANFGSIVFH